MPTGLVLNAGTGVISGTPTTVGTFNSTIQAKDVAGFTTTHAYSVTINAALSITSHATLIAGKLNVLYVVSPQPLVTTGGTGSYTFALTSGTLPPGLSLNSSTGAITGTPTTLGNFTFFIKVTDAVGGTTVPKRFTLRINP